MERCPSCRASCDAGPRCRRCGMDLMHLLAAEEAAERLLGQGIARLAEGDSDAAVAALTQARALVGDPLGEHLLAFARARHQQTLGEHLRAIARALGEPETALRIGKEPSPGERGPATQET